MGLTRCAAGAKAPAAAVSPPRPSPTPLSACPAAAAVRTSTGRCAPSPARATASRTAGAAESAAAWAEDVRGRLAGGCTGGEPDKGLVGAGGEADGLGGPAGETAWGTEGRMRVARGGCVTPQVSLLKRMGSSRS